MSDVAVVTANFGHYDEPRGAVAQEGYEDADWWYFTDDGDYLAPPPWHTTDVLVHPGGFINPRLAAKRHKLTPWRELDGDEPYRWIVWLDANMEVTSPRFLWEVLAGADCSGAPLTAWRHPRRTDALDEIVGSLTEAPAKYGAMREQLEAQGDAYAAEGFPRGLGLFACGTLVWNMEAGGGDGSPRSAHVLGDEWLRDVETHTIQDQVSLPVVAWRLGMHVDTFTADQVPRFQTKPRGAPYIQNRWLRIWPHNRDD